MAGAVVLFLYGWAVNTPPWDLGRLLGVTWSWFSSWRKFSPSQYSDNGGIAASGRAAPSSSEGEW